MGMNPQTIVKRLVKDADYSHASLAAAIHVSQPTITRIFHGQKGCQLKTWQALVELHDKHFPNFEAPAVTPSAGSAPANR